MWAFQIPKVVNDSHSESIIDKSFLDSSPTGVDVMLYSVPFTVCLEGILASQP